MALFKLDENLPRDPAALASDRGHNAMTVGDQQLSGQSDDHIAAVCRREQRILVTLDLDFADIRLHWAIESPGVIVIRLDRQSRTAVSAVFDDVLVAFEEHWIAGSLWIAESKRIRMRSPEV